MGRAKYYDTCLTIRRKLVKHGTMHFGGGPITYHSEEWVTEPCGTPLFGKHTQTGICNSCTNNWQVETNYPMPADQQPKEWHKVMEAR